MNTFSIKLILLYRTLAPKQMRNACLFEPSCSEYGIQALNKYGFIKGWKLILNRIQRCKQPNGGIDHP